MKKYSALIPNGRGQSYLNMTLVSVLTQTNKPSEIIIFNDSDTRHFDQAILSMCDELGIVCKIIRDPFVKSMFAIREALIKEAKYELCLFVDDDMVLDSSVVEDMSVYFDSKIHQLAFVQGLRIEVGGRQNNSKDDINQVRSDTTSGSKIYYGDTAILLFKRETFVSQVPWDKIRELMDNPNLGGSDVVITMSLTSKGYTGIACPEAVGYHFAEPNFSYWAGFATADLYVQRGVTKFIKKEILDLVYNRR